MTCHIRVNNLALTYSWKSYEKKIFHDLNLCIPKGSFVTIIGGNGSGKSSLVKLVLGLATPQSGEVLIDENMVRSGYPTAIKQHHIAYLSQEIEDLFFSETVAEELSYQPSLVEDPETSRIQEALGLNTLLDRRVDSLSGGERQSLALAQFMMEDAQLLIMDEPSSYLDSEKSSLLKAFLESCHQAGKTILHVTQFETELHWGTHILDLNEPVASLVSI